MKKKLQNILGSPLYGMVIAMLITMFSVVVLIFGCNPERKLARKTIARMDKTEQRYLYKSNVDTATLHWVVTRHPVKVSPGSVVIIPGDTVTTEVHDTAYTTLPGTTDTILSTVKISRWHFIHDTVKVRDTLIDSRMLELRDREIVTLRAAVMQQTERADKAVTGRRKAIYFAVAGWLLLVALISIIVIAKKRS